MFKYALVTLPLALANYRSGEVKTIESFLYGRFTVKMQGCNKAGTVGSFFTFWNSLNWSAAEWNELDIELVPSISESPFSTNIIW